jgi:hypothetical protein
MKSVSLSFGKGELLMARSKTVLVWTLASAMLTALSARAQSNEQSGAGERPATPTVRQTVGVGFELLLYEKVRDDIGMTDAQIEKLKSQASQFYADPANAVKTLGKILTPQQIQRLKQIKLQASGAAALSTAEVAKALALTGEQREKLKTLQAEYHDKTHTAVQGAKKKDYKQVRAIMADMRAKHLEAAVQVLTPPQRKKFEKMKGPKVNMDLSKL